MDPPAYEEVATRTDGKRVVQRLMIRDELGLSRRQHVRALVHGLLPRLRERATMGLARSPLLVLPSDQGTHRNTLSESKERDKSDCVAPAVMGDAHTKH
jgi:hypothetical protein